MKTENSREKQGLVQTQSYADLEKFRRPLREYLVSGLEHPDKWVRYLAVEMLGALGDTMAADDVLPLVVSEDTDLRSAALRSVEKMGKYPVEIPQFRTTGCKHCLIRSIADEALARLRTGDPDVAVR